MSNVDDELAQALKDSEDAAQAVPAPVAMPAVRQSPPKRSIGLLVGLLVMGGGVLTLVFTNFKDSMIWAKPVDKLDPQALQGRNLRVQGTLKPGTLMRRDDPCEFRFTVVPTATDGKPTGDKELEVRLPRCTIPDNFKDVPGMPTEVTVEGKMATAGHFEASQVMAKCPTKYEMQERASKGELAPHKVMPGL
ncbi:MAG TPA: cytochrome c maturation protein CcmE [Polyangiaceae bacterium]